MEAGTSEEVEGVARKTEWTEVDAQFLIEAQKKSGVTVTEFSRRHGFTPQRLHRWKGKLRGQPQALRSPGAAKAFLPVRLTGPREASHGALEVVLEGGRRIRIEMDFDAGLLRRVVAALEEGPC